MDKIIEDIYRSLMSSRLPFSTINHRAPQISRVSRHLALYNFFKAGKMYTGSPVEEFMKRYKYVRRY